MKNVQKVRAIFFYHEDICNLSEKAILYDPD